MGSRQPSSTVGCVGTLVRYSDWQFICITVGNLTGGARGRARKERRHEGYATDSRQGPDDPVSLCRIEADAGRASARNPGRSAGQDAGCREEGTWGGKMNEVLDAVESSEADIQEDIEFALIQMKSETLNKINDALVAPRARQLRQLLRLRRGNRRKASSRAALRGPLQGLRGGAGSRRAAAASARRPGAAPARSSSTCKHPAFSNRGFAGGGAHLSPPAPPCTVQRSVRPARTRNEVAMSDQLENLKPRTSRSAIGCSRFRRSCRFCRFGTRSSFRIRSCRSRSRAKARCG